MGTFNLNSAVETHAKAAKSAKERKKGAFLLLQGFHLTGEGVVHLFLPLLRVLCALCVRRTVVSRIKHQTTGCAFETWSLELGASLDVGRLEFGAFQPALAFSSLTA